MVEYFLHSATFFFPPHQRKMLVLKNSKYQKKKIVLTKSLYALFYFEPFFQVPYVSQFPASVRTGEKVVREERYRGEEDRVMEIQLKMQTNPLFLLDSL